MGGRSSLTSKGEPIVSLVGDDSVRSLVVVAGITDRGFGYVEVVVVEETCVNGSHVLVGYLENSDKGILAGQDEIRSPYYETITIVSESCFKNSAIGKISQPLLAREHRQSAFFSTPPAIPTMMGLRSASPLLGFDLQARVSLISWA